MKKFLRVLVCEFFIPNSSLNQTTRQSACEKAGKPAGCFVYLAVC